MSLINKTYSTSSGKNVKSTRQLSGESHQTADWKSKNATVKHSKGGGVDKGGGALGGKASHSN